MQNILIPGQPNPDQSSDSDDDDSDEPDNDDESPSAPTSSAPSEAMDTLSPVLLLPQSSHSPERRPGALIEELE